MLDTWFPAPELGESTSVRHRPSSRATRSPPNWPRWPAPTPTAWGRGRGPHGHRRLDDAAADAHDAYLRLHLLSHRLVKPHGQNLDGMFGLLSNVVWTTLGPVAVDGFEKVRLAPAPRAAVQVTVTASTSSRA